MVPNLEECIDEGSELKGDNDQKIKSRGAVMDPSP